MKLNIETWNKIEEIDKIPINKEAINKFLQDVKEFKGRLKIYELS